jgi:PAS domain S-box-containing protein
MARLAVEHGEARQADGKRRLLAAATEQADELISIMRPDGGMEHANQTFCRMIGCPSDQIVQMNAVEFLADDSRSQLSTIPGRSSPRSQRRRRTTVSGAAHSCVLDKTVRPF